MENSVLQNEYSTWAVLDKHSRSASVLTNDVSRRIGRILGIRPETSSKCLDCHTLSVAEGEKTLSFDTHDGVSCESCHGPASNWLGLHTTRGWNYARSLREGMFDTRDLIKRSEKCLSCHLGNETKWVDHEMLAAGHPDLYFELDSYSAAMPSHWKEPDKDPWADVRVLATGEAVQLRENLRRIARDSARFWPEYSELDCFACHHSLTTGKNSWRQERGYAGRRAGNPTWNSSRYAIFKVVLEHVNSTDAQHLESKLAVVRNLVNDVTADRHRISAAAEAAAEVAGQVAIHMAGLRLDSATALELMRKISADADGISSQGERAAEQAVMVLNSLVIAYSKNAKAASATQTQMKTCVAGLFQLVENPSAYNPTSFANQMRAFNAVVHNQ